MNKKHILKSTSILLASCITFESCGGDLIFDESADEISANISSEEDIAHSIAIKTNYYIDDKSIQYISFIEQLSEDIIRNPTVAEEFIQDPQQYFSILGVDEKININPRLTNCILALSDSEICSAAQEGNVTEYIKLLKEKGYIDKALGNSFDGIYDKSLSENRFSLAGVSGNEELNLSTFAFALAAVVGAVVAVWAVVVEHFGVGNAVGYLTILVAKYAGKETKAKRALSNVQNSSLLSVWKLRNPNTDTYVISNKITEEIVESTIEEIKKYGGVGLDAISERDLRAFILINLQCYDIR